MECNAVNTSLLLNLINNFLIFLTGSLPILNTYLPRKYATPFYNSIENATPL